MTIAHYFLDFRIILRTSAAPTLPAAATTPSVYLFIPLFLGLPTRLAHLSLKLAASDHTSLPSPSADDRSIA
eukprot:CAMPEP_0206584456 /NCGR_PEP_ID=MMETSP0325_2-20121206/35734_1 /ASSEMBLY_ACC=CAM_ASM_000347 /TAXON_ID=2866 /ORGANISM="Crypthecodinium cohnii, Strain Seligo" /LENGTH=71 /DNA_ID=CAMNT_0054091619 /DNA_START=87 /DNA_END=298 /DNA_ORIENTATION=+